MSSNRLQYNNLITSNGIDGNTDEDFNQNESNEQNLNSDNLSNFEWEYHMRREMQEITPHLWLGPYASALKAKIRPNFPEKYHYLTLDIADTPTQNIIQYFSVVSKFIDDCFEKKGSVLVHGNAGISRSAALVIAYIMEKHNLTSTEALRAVQRKRFCIFPNEGFRRQLVEYEPILQAKGIPLSSYGGLKRPFSDEDSENVETNQMHSILMDS